MLTATALNSPNQEFGVWRNGGNGGNGGKRAETGENGEIARIAHGMWKMGEKWNEIPIFFPVPFSPFFWTSKVNTHRRGGWCGCLFAELSLLMSCLLTAGGRWCGSRGFTHSGKPLKYGETLVWGGGGGGGGGGRGALEGRGPQRRSQQRLARRLEEVAEAVRGGYCRLQMPLSLALAARETVAGCRLGALEGGGGTPPPFQCFPGWGCCLSVTHQE